MDTTTSSVNMATSTADLWMIMVDTPTRTEMPTMVDTNTVPVTATAMERDMSTTNSAAMALDSTTTTPVLILVTMAKEDVLPDTGRSADTDTVPPTPSNGEHDDVSIYLHNVRSCECRMNESRKERRRFLICEGNGNGCCGCVIDVLKITMTYRTHMFTGLSCSFFYSFTNNNCSIIINNSTC
mmetsp:Transcript_17298/g.19528  ORF Transcript_17298/g.19528 Transcript_17298/m.19528 type:complete len:183 (+) Transcript_17298:85-633(+)